MGKKYIVPVGMLEAAARALTGGVALPIGTDSANQLKVAIEAVVQWIAENPIVPTDAQVMAMNAPVAADWNGWARVAAVAWQRIMFVAPEPEIPRELALLLTRQGCTYTRDEIDGLIEKAYRIGQKSK